MSIYVSWSREQLYVFLQLRVDVRGKRRGMLAEAKMRECGEGVRTRPRMAYALMPRMWPYALCDNTRDDTVTVCYKLHHGFRLHRALLLR